MPSDLRILDLRTFPLPPSCPSALTIRPLTDEDRTALAHLYLTAYPPAVGATDMEDAGAEIDASLGGEYGELLPEASLLAEDGGAVSGAILTTTRSLWDTELEGPFVIDLFTGPPYRGRGIGRALVLGAAQACRERGDSTLSLRVGEGTSRAAHALYSSLGFRVPG